MKSGGHIWKLVIFIDNYLCCDTLVNRKTVPATSWNRQVIGVTNTYDGQLLARFGS